MPRPVSHGRGGAPIPTDWQQQVAPVQTAIMAESGCTITITPPGSVSTWDPETGRTTTSPRPPVYGPDLDPHHGIAGITLISDSDRQLSVVDEPTTLRIYEVRLPHDAPASIEPGHVVEVVTDPDLDLAGQRLLVRAIERDTRRFSRVLLATLTD